jgi:mannose-1-phosphate guanylyltransferase
MYAVILAGGGGTRLWPLSRASRPKPLLPLLEGGRSLLEATVARLAPIVDPADVYLITDARHAPLIPAAAPSVLLSNVVGEPQGRNTAAAVALAAHAIARPMDEVMISLHADQAIADEPAFRAALLAAADRASHGDIVTLGIEPTEPATGYGYILATGDAMIHAGRPTYRVERFEEKPSLVRAQELIAGGRAFWNAGAFVWRRDTLLSGLAEHSPDVDAPIAGWFAERGPSGGAAPTADGAAEPSSDGAPPGVTVPLSSDDLASVYARLPARAIDYALLEPASVQGRVAVVPAAVGWSDLGSWAALRDYRARTGASPVATEGTASVVEVASDRVLVHAGSGRTVAVVGLDDIVIVDTPDALLVARAEASQDVRLVVERLRDGGREDLL